MKSAKSIGLGTGNSLTLRQAQALLNAPDITTTKGCATVPSSPCSSAVYATPAAVAALADGRCSGGFGPEATVAARQADTPSAIRTLAVAATDNGTAGAGTGRRHQGA